MSNTFTITGSAFTIGEDVTAYASAGDVAALCRNLLGNSAAFSVSSSPMLTEINTWLASGRDTIDTVISNLNYAVPIASTAPLYGMLRDMNTLYAAARAEMSRINVTLGPGERTHGQVFDEMFKTQLNTLSSLNLWTLGALPLDATGTTAKLFGGGISVANKDSYESNTDRVAPRFKRNMLTLTDTNDDYAVV